MIRRRLYKRYWRRRALAAESRAGELDGQVRELAEGLAGVLAGAAQLELLAGGNGQLLGLMRELALHPAELLARDELPGEAEIRASVKAWAPGA